MAEGRRGRARTAAASGASEGRFDELGDLLSTVETAWKARKLGVRGVGSVTKLFSMSVTDLLNEWFESDAVKGMLAVNGVIGTWAGPDEPGTAYVMLHHSIGDVGDGHLGSWGFQQGGMGAVADAIRRSAESFGCEIRTNAKVSKILVRNGGGSWASRSRAARSCARRPASRRSTRRSPSST